MATFDPADHPETFPAIAQGLVRSVADMRRIVENAETICEETGWNPKDTPWTVGLISRRPFTEAELERARQLAKERGWT